MCVYFSHIMRSKRQLRQKCDAVMNYKMALTKQIYLATLCFLFPPTIKVGNGTKKVSRKQNHQRPLVQNRQDVTLIPGS